LLNRKVESSEAMERAAEKQGMPKIGLGFEYIVTAKRPNMDFAGNGKDAWMPMVSVSLPIYRKKYRAAVSESQHMQQAYKAMKADTQNELITEYELALYNRKKASEEIELYELQTVQTKQIVDLLVVEFSTADADFEEILRMQQQLIKYELNTIRSQKDFHVAQAKLLYLSANEQNN
jgi:outer membrane protein TolC